MLRLRLKDTNCDMPLLPLYCIIDCIIMRSLLLIETIHFSLIENKKQQHISTLIVPHGRRTGTANPSLCNDTELLRLSWKETTENETETQEIILMISSATVHGVPLLLLDL